MLRRGGFSLIRLFHRNISNPQRNILRFYQAPKKMSCEIIRRQYTNWKDNATGAKCKYLIGFSLFTWLGFDTNIVEDDIVLNLKRAILLIQSEDYDKAEQMLHITLRLAQQTMNHKAILYIYDLMANLALERDQLDKAKKLFVEVMQRLLASGVPENDIRTLHVSLKLAHICFLSAEFDKAEIGYEWNLEKLDKIPKDQHTDDTLRLMALGKYWYGRLLIEKKNYKHACDLLLESYEIIKNYEEEYTQETVTLLNDIGTTYDSMDDLDAAEEYFLKAIALNKKKPDLKYIGVVHVNLGRVYLRKKMYQNAKKNCGYALKLGVFEKCKPVELEAMLCLQDMKEFL